MRPHLAAAVVSVLLALVGCRGEPPSEVPRGEAPVARDVRVEVVAPSSLEVTFEAVGTVRSKTQAVVGSKVLGYVREVRVREGDRVAARQLLVALEDREFVARLDRAEAAVQEASSALEEARRGVEEAEAGQASARAEHAFAQATSARFAQLLAKELIAAQEFESVEAKRKSAEALAEQARARIHLARARVLQGETRLLQARAEVEVAEVALADTRILAPMAGALVERRVEPGNLAVPGQPLLVLDDVAHYRLEAVVGESAMGGMAVGHVASVTVDALSRTVDGRVAEIVPAADPGSRSVTVKLDLPSELPLRSGMFGRARFLTGTRQALLVPVSAVVERGQLTGLYVVDEEQIARLRFVTLGQRVGDRIEVLSGLGSGERIVTEGGQRVSDGSRVAPSR